MNKVYRLKPGLDLRITDLKDGLSFVHYVNDYVQWETEHVNALFEPVDPVVLREQITEIFIDHANKIGESDFADGKQHKKITNKAVDAVFSLITGAENV